MLTNESEFHVLLARYEDDPGICSKILRTYALTDPKVFLEYAQKAILEQPVSRGLKFVAGLAIAGGIMDALLDMYSRSRTECLQLGQKLIACEPRFDITFLEFLQRSRPDGANEENLFHMGLDILDLISQGDRLVPGVLKILKHPNPKIRSKAALFIGGRTQNLAWAVSRTSEYDARVRANILESLHGVNSDFVHQMFRNNVADENNRVAGNAILGLYLLGDISSIPLIYDLARHPDSRFRNTCAWLMGRTGDPRFAQAFSELMNDPDELVRAQAFKGLGEVRKALRASANRPQLRSGIVKVNPGDEPSLIATVHDQAGNPVRGIPPLSFILKAGSPSKIVRAFRVEEVDCRSQISVAFILCLPAEEETAADGRFVEIIQSCSNLRRPRDRWTVVKVRAKTISNRRPAGAGSPEPDSRYRSKFSILHVDLETAAVNLEEEPDHRGFDYSPLQHRIDAMLRQKPITLGVGVDDPAAKPVIDSLLRGDIAASNRHLIFFGAGPRPHLLDALASKHEGVPTTIHILAHTPAWQTPAARELALKTGGTYRAVSGAGLGDACFEIYASLVHHYRIGWKEAPADSLELDLYCNAGKSSTAYEELLPPAVPDALSA